MYFFFLILIRPSKLTYLNFITKYNTVIVILCVKYFEHNIIILHFQFKGRFMLFLIKNSVLNFNRTKYIIHNML